MYFSRVRLRPEFIQTSQINRVLQDNAYGIHRLLHDLFDDQKRQFVFREEIARQQLGYAKNVKGEPVYYLLSQNKPKDDNPLFQVETKPYRPKLETGQILTFDCRVNPVITKNGKKHDVVMNAQRDFLKTAVQELELQAGLPAEPKKSDYKKLILSAPSSKVNEYLTQKIQQYPAYTEILRQKNTVKTKLNQAIQVSIEVKVQNWFICQGEERPNAVTHGFVILDDNNGGKKLQVTGYQWHALPEKGKKAGFSSVDLAGQLQITDLSGFEQCLFKGIGRSKAFGCGLLMIKRC
jgi:CRISPR system Cascade subunit CasE